MTAMAKYRVMMTNGNIRHVDAERVRVEGEPPEQVVVLCDTRTIDGRQVVAMAEPHFLVPVSQLGFIERVAT